MKKIISGIFAILLMALTIPVSANSTCFAGMIRNSYGVVGTADIQGMFCGVTGVVTFKNNGVATATMKQSCAGFVETITGTGTYTVKRDCTGEAIVEFSDDTSGTYYFTIVAGGKKLMYIGTEVAAGVTFAGTAEQL